jgi:aconitase A
MNEFNQMLKNNLNFIREEELPETPLESKPKADSSKTTKKEIKTPVKETQAQYQNRIKEEKARQKYPQLFKNYDQTTSDVGGTLIDVTNAEEMERLEREGRFVNTD